MSLQQKLMPPSRVAPSCCNGGGPMTLQKTTDQWPLEAAIWHQELIVGALVTSHCSFCSAVTAN